MKKRVGTLLLVLLTICAQASADESAKINLMMPGGLMKISYNIATYCEFVFPDNREQNFMIGPMTNYDYTTISVSPGPIRINYIILYKEKMTDNSYEYITGSIGTNRECPHINKYYENDLKDGDEKYLVPLSVLGMVGSRYAYQINYNGELFEEVYKDKYEKWLEKCKKNAAGGGGGIMGALTGTASAGKTIRKTYPKPEAAPQTGYAYNIAPQPAPKPMAPKRTSDVDTSIPQTNKTMDDTYVLIIANEEYEYLDQVNYATNDGETFKEYCIKTLGVPERQVFYYPNASFGKLADGISKLTYCLNNFEGSRAIVYYCGHGIPDEKTSEAYIIPVDGKGTNMETCFSLNKLYKTLSATKAANVTYFMDACFTGANKEGTMLVAARGVAREAKKETIEGKSVVFSASSGDETAMTYHDKQHGLFTYYLLKKLQQTEGDVSYEELADYINRNVKKDAFLMNEKPQTPVVATSPEAASSWKNMKLK